MSGFNLYNYLESRTKAERIIVYSLLLLMFLDCGWALTVDARSYFWGIKPSPFDKLAGNFGISAALIFWTWGLVRKKSKWAYLVAIITLFRIYLAIVDYRAYFKWVE